VNPYSGRNAPLLKRTTPIQTRRPDVPRGFPVVGNGLGGFPTRKPELPDAWVLTVDITEGGQTYTIDIEAGTGIDLYIDWGDGLIERFQTTGDKDHTYSQPGRYFPRITGGFASDGNIRLGSNSSNRARMTATGVIPLIPGLANFQSTFLSCTGLTAIPTDLFRYNTVVSISGFRDTFYGCTALTAIPADLFRYNVNASTSGFYATFRGCTGLTAIPSGLFDYNVNVSTSGFLGTFYGCTALTAIPADLFRYNVNASTSGFRETFFGCTGLTTAPALLFKYNTACTSFLSVFQNCNKLQLRADLFFDTGEETTRFLNQSVNFTDAMRIGTFTGTQGTAPALWDCDFGTGTPTTTTCFTGHTSSTVTNHADIPTAWGGPA